MNVDDWHAHLAAAPVTVNQRGRIAAECQRLGLTDRAERLELLAALAGLDELDTTADLTQGQAGQLCGILLRTRDRGELPDLTDVDEDQGEDLDPSPRYTLADLLADLTAAIRATWPDLGG